MLDFKKIEYLTYTYCFISFIWPFTEDVRLWGYREC